MTRQERMYKVKRARFNNIGVLTAKKSWFISYGRKFVKILRSKGYRARLFLDHNDLGEGFQVVFMLSYFNIVQKDFLKKHKHNLIVHESDLPKGKGWVPLFWQILEGKNKIPVVLFEATEKVDSGVVYIKDYILLKGHELHDEIRRLQAEKTIEICLRFLEGYENLKLVKHNGKATYYRKRLPENSKLDINKSIKEQFNLLRSVNNNEFPGFFYYKGHKYRIEIYAGGKHEEAN
ncbi:formyltransferase family protein [Candidatus Omnitrophota bacterium]